MKQRVLKMASLLLAVIMILGMAAACGGSATPSSTPATTAAATDAPAAEPEAPAAEPEAPAAEPAAEPEAPAAEEPNAAEVAADKPNLEGREIIVADWWTDNEAVEGPPPNLREESWREYRDGILEEYNFKWTRQNIAAWDNYLELFTTSVMAGEPAADIFIMSSPWAWQLQKQGLLYPLNTLESINLQDPKWTSA
jgi:ABC-type glycerol-3-phosphate transport system substrate-binding protein